jgi:type III pantothenate kinase
MSSPPVLLVDLGNTRAKWALLVEGVRGPATAMLHAPAGVGEALRSAWAELPRPAEVLVGSVAGAERNQALGTLCQALWDREPRFVAAEARAAGVSNGYEVPGQLGIDRWLALLAARADGRGPACVLDCGTAVTIDLIDGAGRHQGGLILPGLSLMRECLLARTRIPPVATPAARPELGRGTGAAMANGALLAVLGAVRETLARAATGGLGAARLVVTGGDGAAVVASWDAPAELRPDLVLEGLAVVAGTRGT